ncbi:MAG: hypothetical protein HQL63_06445 [Magnetococcales bacterium]|nr:hypothetical protein [Magnetococcales bacterium]
MNEHVTSELTLVTPQHADAWLRTFAYEKQRNLSDQHIQRLAVEMARGRFIEGTTIHFAQVGRQKFLINGNHTLHAVVKSGVTIPLTVLTTPVDDMKTVARLYARHDIHRRRDWSATIRASDLEINVPASFKNAASAALRIIMSGLDSPISRDVEIAHSRDLRLDAMDLYREHIEAYHTAIGGGVKQNQKVLMRAAVMAVGLETLKWQPNQGYDFWNGIAADDGLRRTDPRKTLLIYLTSTPASGSNIMDHIKAVALAWNAFVQGRQLSALKLTAFTQFQLAGTPYRKGAVERPLAVLVNHVHARNEAESAEVAQ